MNCWSVPKTVLREQFEDQVEEDERADPDYDVDYDPSVDNALRENHVFSESPKLAVAGGKHNNSLPGDPAAAENPSQVPPHHDQETNSMFYLK